MDNLPPTPPPVSPVPPLPPTPPPVPSTDVRNWLIGLHLSPLIGIWLGGIGSIAAPLIIWLIKRESSPEIDTQGKQAINFQISIAIYAFISVILTFILIGFLTICAVGILWLYGMIKAAIDVNNGVPVKYPLTIPLLK